MFLTLCTGGRHNVSIVSETLVFGFLVPLQRFGCFRLGLFCFLVPLQRFGSEAAKNLGGVPKNIFLTLDTPLNCCVDTRNVNLMFNLMYPALGVIPE